MREFQSGVEGRHDPSKLGLFVNVYCSKTCVPLMHYAVCKQTHIVCMCVGKKKEFKLFDVTGERLRTADVVLSSCSQGAWPGCPAAPSARRSCCPAAPAASAGFCERLPSPAGCSPDAAAGRSAGPPASGSSTPFPETRNQSISGNWLKQAKHRSALMHNIFQTIFLLCKTFILPIIQLLQWFRDLGVLCCSPGRLAYSPDSSASDSFISTLSNILKYRNYSFNQILHVNLRE